MKNKYESQILSCTFAEQLAAYLYNEIQDTEKVLFETHLENCETCPVELVDFGMMRSSILEWRETDFAPLQIPVFVLPAAREFAEEKRSWFATLQAFFTLSPARTTFASLVALLFFAGIFWVATNSFHHEELADLSNVEKVKAKDEKAQIENENALLPSPSPAKQNESVKKSAESPDKTVIVPKPQLADSKNVVEPDKIVTVPVIQKTLTKTSAPKTNTKPQVKTPTRNEVPAIDDSDDDDGNSLRLTDIFDEIGMNESGNKEVSDSNE